MFRSQGYIQYFALLLIICPFFIGQVSSLKCYNCLSPDPRNCVNTNNKTVREIECADNGNQYQCQLIFGYNLENGGVMTIRGCKQDLISCDTIKMQLTINGNGYGHKMQVDSCKFCDSDLCNSSGQLHAGFWSLSLTLLAMYLVKY